MRLIWICIASALFAVGCQSARQPGASPDNPSGYPGGRSRDSFQKVVPIDDPTGKVAAVNVVSRFVVIDFYLSALPIPGMRMNVYREGLKVGEVRITGPEQFSNIAADILAGEIRVGDEVRPK